DEPLFDRGVRADPADGRSRWAHLPRIRDDPVDRAPDLPRRVADDDADDVRLYRDVPPAAPAASLVRRQRAGLRLDAALLRPHLATRPAPPRACHAGPVADDRPQHLPLYNRAQGAVPAAGYRAHGRRPPGRPEHLVPDDAPEAAPVCQ